MSRIARAKGFVSGRAAVLSAVWSHPLNRGSRARALADYAVWNAVRFGMRARHVLPLADGVEIILGRQENYASAVYANNLADFPEMLFLAHLLRPGDLLLDVGANAGMYSVWAAGVAGARSLAFEPVPATFRLLQQNIRLNDLGALVAARQVAAGAEPGFVEMTAGEGGLNHVVTDGAGPHSVQVEVETVDRLAAGEAPVAMKIDVEGYEMSVLRGARSILSAPSLAAVVIELQDWMLRRYGASEGEVRAHLESFGFVPRFYDPAARRLSARPDRRGLNAIFVRHGEEMAGRLASAPPVRTPFAPGGI